MQTAKEHGTVFNNAKCHIRQPQIAFYGTVFTAQGMWQDPTKIQALQALPTLTPRLSFSLPRTDQLPANLYTWSVQNKLCSSMKSLPSGTGNHLQMWLSSASKPVSARPAQCLVYYDRSKPVIVQTDASEYGLGAALIQSSCLIAFASKTLTDIETHYVNILVCYSLKKFHTYTYGRHIMVQNDHKLLKIIKQKPIHVAPLMSADASAHADV